MLFRYSLRQGVVGSNPLNLVRVERKGPLQRRAFWIERKRFGEMTLRREMP